jgi:hypothetical protein
MTAESSTHELGDASGVMWSVYDGLRSSVRVSVLSLRRTARFCFGSNSPLPPPSALGVLLPRSVDGEFVPHLRTHAAQRALHRTNLNHPILMSQVKHNAHDNPSPRALT